MRFLKQHLLAVLVMAFTLMSALVSCDNTPVEPDDDGGGGEVVVPEDTTVLPRLMVNPAEVTLSEADTTITIRVSSNTSWSLRGKSNWCSVDPESGEAGDTEVTLVIEANDTEKGRSMALEFYTQATPQSKRTVTISQGFNVVYDVSVSENSFEADYNGGTFSTKITSDKDWEIVGAPEWITVKPTKGPKGNSSVDLIVAPYDEYAERSAEMVFVGDFDSADTLRVRQTGRLIFGTNSPLEYSIVPVGDTLNLKVLSNVDYIIEYSDHWLRCSATEGVASPDTVNYRLVVTKNYNETREGWVAITAPEADSTITFNFEQEGTRIIATGNDIVRFKFMKVNNPKLKEDVTLTIAGDSIYGHLPYIEADITSLVVNFSCSSMADAYVGDSKQVSGLSRQDFSEDVEYIVVSESGEEKRYTVSVSYFTGLPVLYLSTDTSYEITSTEEWSNASAHMYGGPKYDGFGDNSLRIKGLDDASWLTDAAKRSYDVIFDSDVEVLGMPANREWCLISNYADKTLLRNQVALELGRATELEWTPQGVQVELVLNGAYRGTYLLCEKIVINNNRLPITGGCLLEVDRNPNSNLYSFTSKYMTGSLFATTDKALVKVKYPTKASATSTFLSGVESHFAKAEEAICNNNGNWSEALSTYVDINSIVDQWLIYEIAATPNPVRGPFGFYLYKKANDSKFYGGPLWDFVKQSFVPTTQSQWVNNSAGWIGYLWSCPEFKTTVKEHWSKYKEKFYAVADSYIAEQEAYLSKSAVENWAIHDQNLINDGRSENGDERLSSTEAIARMRSVLKSRLDWLDQQITNWPDAGADATIDKIGSDNTDKNKEDFWN